MIGVLVSGEGTNLQALVDAGRECVGDRLRARELRQ
jgi:folate-dependent phosphoribosylglycinamide formyltransferase PurN